jgi:hypothetical protein
MHDKQEGKKAFEQNCGWGGARLSEMRDKIVMMNNTLMLNTILDVFVRFFIIHIFQKTKSSPLFSYSKLARGYSFSALAH